MSNTLYMRMPVAPDTIIELHVIGEPLTGEALDMLSCYLELARRDLDINPPSTKAEREAEQRRARGEA